MSAFGDLAKGKRNWQVIAFTLCAIVLVQGLVTYRLAAAARAVPYLVQVDRLGQLAVAGRAQPLTDPDGRLVASQIADFIRTIRTVLPTTAAGAQADLLRRGYAFATPNAAAFLNNYFSDPAHDPRVLGQRLTRDVRLSSALTLPPSGSTRGDTRQAQTWRLQWIETERPLGLADSAAISSWEGYVTLQIVPPKVPESIESNPLGVRITSISWTRLAGQLIPAGSDSAGR